MKVGAVAFALVGAVACNACSSEAPATAVPALSTKDTNANAARLAHFVQQECFDRADDRTRFEAGLRASGWQITLRQLANPKQPNSVDYWASSDVELVRGEVSPGRAYICTVAVTPQIAPSLSALNDALSHTAGSNPDASGEWWWKPTKTRGHHMTVAGDPTKAEKVSVTVETFIYPWWQSILGSH
ncbi:MAG TPA: hypothetical protein VIC34_08750 [Croceibacterium sp.]